MRRPKCRKPRETARPQTQGEAPVAPVTSPTPSPNTASTPTLTPTTPTATAPTTTMLPPPGFTGPPVAEGPCERYVAYTEPPLSPTDVGVKAREGWANGNEGTVTSVQVVATTVGQAMVASTPDMILPPRDECNGYLEDDAYLVVLHGAFTLDTASVPYGAKAPHGSVLEYVVNAHTGFGYGESLSDVQHPAELATLGPVTTLQ